jgi:hypothetical protein
VGQYKNHCKWAIVVVASVTVLMLISLLVIIPYVYGLNFASFSPQLYYASGPGTPTMEVIYVNGSVVPITWIGLRVNVTNTYLVPVHIAYNGFDYVMLVYNRTVDNPDDVMLNKKFLVWGAFYGFYLYPPSNELYYDGGLEYYASRRGLSNYTATIPVGAWTYYVFHEPFAPVWRSEDLKLNPISHGGYHIYCIAYGQVLKPMDLTVTTVSHT